MFLMKFTFLLEVPVNWFYYIQPPTAATCLSGEDLCRPSYNTCCKVLQQSFSQMVTPNLVQYYWNPNKVIVLHPCTKETWSCQNWVSQQESKLFTESSFLLVSGIIWCWFRDKVSSICWPFLASSCLGSICLFSSKLVAEDGAFRAISELPFDANLSVKNTNYPNGSHGRMYIRNLYFLKCNYSSDCLKILKKKIRKQKNLLLGQVGLFWCQIV